jgi:hypothetical protein
MSEVFTGEDYLTFKALGGDPLDLEYAGSSGWDWFFYGPNKELYKDPSHPIRLVEKDYLLNPGPNALNFQGLPPFMRKVVMEDEERFGLYREAGADFTLTDSQGRTVLHKAAEYGLPDTLDWIPQIDALLNSQNASGQSALHVAIGEGNFAMGKELIERGIDVRLKDSIGRTAIDYFSTRRYSQGEYLFWQLKRQTPLYEELLALPEIGEQLASIAQENEGIQEQNFKEIELARRTELGFWSLVVPTGYLLGSIAHRENGGAGENSTFFSHTSAGITMAASGGLLTAGLTTVFWPSSDRGSINNTIGTLIFSAGVGTLSGIIGTAFLGEQMNADPFLYYLGPTIASIGGLVVFMIWY